MAAAAAPRNAYVVVGHSGEGVGSAKVPPGCVVVIRQKPGQVTNAQQIIHDLLCDRSDDLFDPLENPQAIVDKFGSVAIYPPGSEPPNMSFRLFTGWDIPQNRIRFLPMSGVIPIGRAGSAARRAVCAAIGEPLVRVNASAPPDFIVPDMFEHSEFPTRNDVEGALRASGDATIGDLFKSKTSPKPFKGVVKTTLQSIMNSVGGILYVVGCRGSCVDIYDTIPGTSKKEPYEYMPIYNDSTILTAYRKKGKTTTRRAAPRLYLEAQALLGRTISNAELHRKSAVRGSRFTQLARNYRPPPPPPPPPAPRSRTRRSGSRNRANE